jgi:hypothetical protein
MLVTTPAFRLFLLVSCKASFFHPEYGGHMFFRDVGLSPNYTALQPSAVLFNI